MISRESPPACISKDFKKAQCPDTYRRGKKYAKNSKYFKKTIDKYRKYGIILVLSKDSRFR